MRTFETLSQVKEFCEELSEELKLCCLFELSELISFFQVNTYTTSSEYLGELRIVLRKILIESSDVLNQNVIDDIEHLINQINKAFN